MITADILTHESWDKQATNDQDLQGLIFAIAGLKDQGKTDDDLKIYEDYQQTAVTCITNFINGFSITEQKSLDVPCKIEKNDDGKFYYIPEDFDKVFNFIKGK